MALALAQGTDGSLRRRELYYVALFRCLEAQNKAGVQKDMFSVQHEGVHLAVLQHHDSGAAGREASGGKDGSGQGAQGVLNVTVAQHGLRARGKRDEAEQHNKGK